MENHDLIPEIIPEVDAYCKTDRLKNQSVPRLILGYFFVALLGMFTSSLYSLTDAFFVGQSVGPEALGAVAAVLPVVVFQGALASFLSGGAAIVVSHLLGKKKKKKASSVALTAMITFWVVAIIFTILARIFIEEILTLLGVADELRHHARQYIIILIYGTVFSAGFTSIIRAEGKPFYALLQWLLPLGLNVALSYIFVMRHDFGIQGAAFSTVVSHVFKFAMFVMFFARLSSLNLRHARFDFKSLGSISALGLPSLVQSVTLALGIAIFTNVVNRFGGAEMQITYGLVSKIFIAFAIVPFTAAAQAIKPVAGYSYGLGCIDRVKTAFWFSTLLSLFSAIVTFVICQLFAPQIVGIFTDDAAIIQNGATALRVVSLALPFAFLATVGGAFFQSIGKKTASVILYALMCVLMPPLALQLGRSFNSYTIWFSFPAAAAIAFVVAVIILASYFTRLKKQRITM